MKETKKQQPHLDDIIQALVFELLSADFHYARFEAAFPCHEL
jgi:hypothetical protein